MQSLAGSRYRKKRHNFWLVEAGKEAPSLRSCRPLICECHRYYETVIVSKLWTCLKMVVLLSEVGSNELHLLE